MEDPLKKTNWPALIIGTIFVVIVIVLGFYICLNSGNKTSEIDSTGANGIELKINNDGEEGEENEMKISTSAFENNTKIPAKYTCDGDNVNPPLIISDIPSGAKSLAIIVEDPDAPSGIWTHWLVWNIGPATTEIVENSVPEGSMEGTTSFGKTGYGGPCPPSGTHRYFFKVYALDRELDLAAESTAEDLQGKIQGHILVQAELIGLYR